MQVCNKNLPVKRILNWNDFIFVNIWIHGDCRGHCISNVVSWETLLLQCHISLVPIYACTRDRRLFHFTTKTIITSLLLSILSYTVTASFGYLTFGSHIKADILSSYAPTWDVLLAVITIAIKMYTTYPILLYVGR